MSVCRPPCLSSLCILQAACLYLCTVSLSCWPRPSVSLSLFLVVCHRFYLCHVCLSIFVCHVRLSLFVVLCHRFCLCHVCLSIFVCHIRLPLCLIVSLSLSFTLCHVCLSLSVAVCLHPVLARGQIKYVILLVVTTDLCRFPLCPHGLCIVTVNPKCVCSFINVRVSVEFTQFMLITIERDSCVSKYATCVGCSWLKCQYFIEMCLSFSV